MSTGMRARMATMRMRRKKHPKLMIDQRRMWRPQGIVEPVMSTGIRARMAKIRMRRKKYQKADDGSMPNVED